jgi:hypothetical protein
MGYLIFKPAIFSLPNFCNNLCVSSVLFKKTPKILQPYSSLNSAIAKTKKNCTYSAAKKARWELLLAHDESPLLPVDLIMLPKSFCAMV